MIIGSKYIFRKNIESTNTYASGLIRSDSVREGTIIYTDFQSAGRGQRGNTWVSEEGKNLLFSMILFPVMVSPGEQFILSMFISLGICDFLKSLITDCKIKWPNDIYVGDDKIAGILIENSITGNSIINSIAGIGLNINQENFPEDLPNPVSLKILTGKESDPDSCMKKLARCLDLRYKQLISGQVDELRNEYISSLYQLDKWRSFKSENGIFRGKILSVTESGCLRVEEKAGKILEFRFREIEFIP